jgi:hypothetical protein
VDVGVPVDHEDLALERSGLGGEQLDELLEGGSLLGAVAIC